MRRLMDRQTNRQEQERRTKTEMIKDNKFSVLLDRKCLKYKYCMSTIAECNRKVKIDLAENASYI